MPEQTTCLVYKFDTELLLDRQIAPGSVVEVGITGCFDTILYSGNVFFLFFFLREPLPWVKSNPTHGWSHDVSLLARHHTHGSFSFSSLDNRSFQKSQTARRGLHQRK